MWVWYYDRQGTIQSSGINFIQDLARFMVLLYALQRFTLGDWGRNTAFLEDKKKGLHTITIDGVDLELQTSDDEIVTHYGLKGRATNVFPVTSKKLAEDFPEVQEDGMVAKIFWAEEQRTSEPEILEKVNEIAAEKDNVKGHVPHLLWHHKFTNPTSAVRKALGVAEPTKGSRVLYILVFRKLRSITELQGEDFFKAWRQCILCMLFFEFILLSVEQMRVVGHLDLWKGGVLHRDVSPGNMMYYRTKDGTLMGVMNDYDLSSLATSVGPEGNERTGTVPFMALDLLTPEGQRGEVKHLYRHDLESFIWVLVWVSLRYRDGLLLEPPSRPLDVWATAGAQACHNEKYVFLSYFLKFRPLDIDPRIWSLVVECLAVLKKDIDRRVDIQILQELSSDAGEDENMHGEEDELDGDDFLHLFMSTKTWVRLCTIVS